MNAYGKIRCYSPWRKFRDRWLGFFLTLRQGKIDHVTDHLIVSYINYLLAAVEEEREGCPANESLNLVLPETILSR